MKNKILKCIGLVIFASVIHIATLQAQGYSDFATSGTAINGGTNYLVIPGESAAQINDSQGRPVSPPPVITFLTVRSLATTAATLQSYVSTNSTFATSANTTTTNFVNSTNGFVAAQWVVIHHNGLDSRFADEAAIISAVQNTNQIVLATAPVTAVAAGDQIFQQTASSLIAIVSSASTPTTLTGPGILTGQRGKPYLLVLSSPSASTNTIDACNATFTH